jgi:hypothetical protein
MATFKISVIATMLFAASFAQGSVKHKKIESSKNIEMWCGSPGTKGRNDFPYVAAIRNYQPKKGHFRQIVTIYKDGKPVMKNYVSKIYKGSEAIYASADQDFKLDLTSQSSVNSLADFRAVIHERDGDTLVANGQFPCHRQKG